MRCLDENVNDSLFCQVRKQRWYIHRFISIRFVGYTTRFGTTRQQGKNESWQCNRWLVRMFCKQSQNRQWKKYNPVSDKYQSLPIKFKFRLFSVFIFYWALLYHSTDHDFLIFPRIIDSFVNKSPVQPLVNHCIALHGTKWMLVMMSMTLVLVKSRNCLQRMDTTLCIDSHSFSKIEIPSTCIQFLFYPSAVFIPLQTTTTSPAVFYDTALIH